MGEGGEVGGGGSGEVGKGGVGGLKVARQFNERTVNGKTSKFVFNLCLLTNVFPWQLVTE